MNLRRFFFYCIIVGLLVIIQIIDRADMASAQTKEQPVQSALSVSPAIIEETLTPGKNTSFTLHVRNITDSPLPVAAFARPFTVQSTQLEKTDHDRLDASQWLRFLSLN